MNMKRITFIVSLLFIAVNLAQGQQVDKNNSDYLSQKDFNNDKNLITVNGVFVKSSIGINLDSLTDPNIIITKFPFTIHEINAKHDSIVVKSQSSVININGFEYNGKFDFKMRQNIQLITLNEVKRIYFPKITAPCIFMINKFFIINDVQSYKIDKDYILNVELINHKEAQSADSKDQYIIRIFTKNKRNLEDHSVVRLR